MTDAMIEQVEERAAQTWPIGTSVVLETVREKLRNFRERNLRKILTPLDAIVLYDDMCDLFEREYREICSFPVVGTFTPPKIQMLPFASNAYPLFVRGKALPPRPR